MAIEAGREYNPETAAALRPRDFHFVAHGEAFRFTLQIPEYILARLDSTIMDKLNDYMSSYCARIVIDAIRGGYLHTDEGRKRMRSDVGAHLRNYIWERFSITQEEKGNECWQVAPSLQRVIGA